MSDLEHEVQTSEQPVSTETPQPTQTEEMFDIDGQKLPYSQLKPEQVRNWYNDANNKRQWSQTNTKEAQRLASERKRLEAISTQYAAINQELEGNPELFQIFKEYLTAKRAGQDGKAAVLAKVFNQKAQQETNRQLQMPRQINESQAEYEKRIADLEQKFALKEQEEADKRAREYLKTKFSDLDEGAFDKYAEAMSLDEPGKALELFEKARRYDQMVNQQNGQNANMLGGKITIDNSVPDNSDRSAAMSNDDAFAEAARKAGFKDYRT